MSQLQQSPIVLLGAEDDEHIMALAQELRGRGERPLVIDPRQFPRQLTVSLGADLDDIRVGDHSGLVPRAVYLRSLYTDPAGHRTNVEQSMEDDWRRTSAALTERWHMWSSLLFRWSELGVRLYNPAECAQRLTKPYQLALLRRAGLPVPNTLWSNDPVAVTEFAGRHTATIYKPVQGGAHTRELQPRDLEPARLARLQASPVCFQELLPGRNLRVYVVEERVVCALSVESEALDFREFQQANVTAIELGPELARQCVAATRCLGLRFTGMDLREDAEGRPLFLELNSSPMFLGFESAAHVKIGSVLCDALIG
ncbi:MAG: hypothetical protein RL685_3583 [Pseudomonadota bacterium]